MTWRKIQKKGGSHWVVVPAEIMKEFGLKAGDSLNFQSHKDQNYIHVGVVPPSSEMLKRRGAVA